MRYESLEAELSDVLRFCGLPQVDLGHENATPGKRPWQEYYDDRSLQAVWDRFSVEITLYGYHYGAEENSP